MRVGYATLIRDAPTVVRTGVTAIWPRGAEIWTDCRLRRHPLVQRQRRDDRLAWIAEQGMLGAPICITNTHSVGVVRDAICAYAVRDRRAAGLGYLPVVGRDL